MSGNSRALRTLIAMAGLATGLAGGISAAQAADAQGENAALVTLQHMFPGTYANTDGGRVLTIGGAPMNDAASATQAADDWVRNFIDALNVGTLKLGDDLEHAWEGAVGHGPLSVVAYKQYMDGLPVEMGTLRMVILNRPAPVGHLQATTHHVTMANARLTPRPEGGFAPDAFTADQAKERVTRVGRFAAMTEWTQPEQVVYSGEGDFFPSITAVRAWKFTGANRTDPANPSIYTFFVDSATNDLVFARNDILHADITGSVVGLATPGFNAASSANPAVLTPVNEIKVSVAGTSPEVFAYTDRQGNFTIPWAGTDPVSLVVSTSGGRWSRVENNAGAEISVTQPGVIPGTPATININPTDAPQDNAATTAQINALIHTNISHNFIRDRQPSLTTVDNNITTNVQLAQTCNAFFSPFEQSINFFSFGGGCVNTAYNSVVNHEYGHYYVNRRPPVDTLQQGAFGEGFADTIAILINDDPVIAPGFFIGQTPGWIRNPATANRTFPCSGGIHDCGQVLGGFVWDVKNLFVARDGSALGLENVRQLHTDYYMITQGNDNQGNALHPASATEYLTADDDDGQIGNGTPNYGLIRAAMLTRNITNLPCVDSRASISVLTGVPSFTLSNTPLTYTLRVRSNDEQIIPSTIRVEYRLNGQGSYQSVFATPTSGDEYAVTLPGIPCGNSFQFRFAVDTTTSGSTVIAPIDNTCGPSTFTTAAFDTFTDSLSDFEGSANGWTEGPLAGTFHSIGGRFAVVVPTTNNPSAPNADTSPDPGNKCWLTNNPSSTAGLTGGATTITSPSLDLSALDDATFTYNRWWFSNGANEGTLRDFFRVQVSTDGGTTWTNAENLGPNGGTTGWTAGSFTLSGLGLSVSSNVRLRFVAANLGPGNTLYAAIDDVRVRGTLCNSGPVCDSIDFNNDNATFDPTDIDAFLSVYSEGPCVPATATCNDIDFNNDNASFDPTDIDAFLSVFSEGPCF